MKLVIVESPKKSETFRRYLGDDFVVLATQGHLRDLATSGKGGLGIDIENDFRPNYKIMEKKSGIFEAILAKSKKAEEVILATDPDREGEAIAWHLADMLKLNIAKTKRLEFHEITRESITHAIENPRHIDMNLVNSQETRRILDRIIGFRLSSLLQKKLKSPSAGRVQSATLKMIADHESEVVNFVPKEYWEILAKVTICDQETTFKLSKIAGKKATIEDRESAETILAKLGDVLSVEELITKMRIVSSKPPFKTSTLQQEAYNRLGFSTTKTASVAQSLYEGVKIGDKQEGLITYTRTDSTKLSDTYIARARAYISETFGPEYIGHVKQEKGSRLDQDAHEAIRPTSNHMTPNSISKHLSYDQIRLYRLIYNRSLASLMSDAKEEVTTAILRSGNLEFHFDTKKVLFDGHRKLYEDIDEGEYLCVQNVKKGDVFKINQKEKVQKFTTPPPRYSEAKIVQMMEEAGIGRPSTYASTIRLLYSRDYIKKTSEGIVTTEQGMLTAKVINKYFPEFTDVNFTAKMESDLDQIQFGTSHQLDFLKGFYYPFEEKIKNANLIMYKQPEIQTGEKCPRCGSPLIKKSGKHGEFTACSSFPKCTYIKRVEKPKAEPTGELCPKCKSPLVIRTNSKGEKFIGCSTYPKCDYVKDDGHQKPKSKRTFHKFHAKKKNIN
ncbi:MAG: type I DNA topoisomerase [Bacilli bacterium]|jgi:DNA topoisomerase-1